MKRFIILGLVLFVATVGKSQNEDYRSNIGLNVGYGLPNIISFLANTVNDSIGSTTFKASSMPQLSLNYDYGINSWFSIGGSIAYGHVKLTDSNYTTIINGAEKTGDYSFKAARTSLGARVLFHYGNAGKIDMYSGIRVGASLWRGSVTSDVFTIDDINTDDLPDNFSGSASSTLVNFQFILFGIRGYVTDNIGIGAEICAGGAPHIAALNVNYRF